MRNGHRHKNLYITLALRKTDDGKWWCRASVVGTDWEPHDEIDDVKNAAMKKALGKAKKDIDRLKDFYKRLGAGELIPIVSRRV